MQPKKHLQSISVQLHNVESDEIFSTPILGNSNSEVAGLIEQLGNSDWVNQGLLYLPNDKVDSTAQCPFCQEETITAKFIDDIRSYFNVSYHNKINTLEHLLGIYREEVNGLAGISDYTEHPFAEERERSLRDKYRLLVDTLQKTLRR